MKTIALAWIVASSIVLSQQTEEEKRFYADFERSESQAIAAYPDAAKPDSPIAKKMAEMDSALKTAEDPLYNSADKPMVLAQRAAKELGIAAVAPKPVEKTPAKPLPKAVTAAQVKAYWLRNIVEPRALDQDRNRILASNNALIAQIKAGKRDLDAAEMAATYNKARAVEAGYIEVAQVYETEIARIVATRLAENEAAARDKKASRERAQFNQLTLDLGRISQGLQDIQNGR